MKISTNTDFFPAPEAAGDAIRLTHDAGFDCFDLSLFGMKADDHPFNAPGYEKHARELRHIANECGIVCNQSHAPFPSSYPDTTPEWIAANRTIPDKLRRAMEIAAIVGAKTIVVHPQQHLHWNGNAAALQEMNRTFYSSLLPHCREYGIRVGVENMWQMNRYGKNIVDSTCANPSEFLSYMEMLDPEWFVACLDIGHCTLTDHSPAEAIRALGHRHLHALHVHDNDGAGDLHSMPFQCPSARVNWEKTTDALAEIDYDGDITLELNYLAGKLPADLLPADLKYAAATARYLAGEVERKKTR